jgi:hypothetical protein
MNEEPEIKQRGIIYDCIMGMVISHFHIAFSHDSLSSGSMQPDLKIE